MSLQPRGGLRSAGALLLVVDQFEELFTACGDVAERTRFVAALTDLAGVAADPVRVVLGVRADFLPHCAGLPAMVTALTDAQVLVGPMDSDGLRQVVEEPARRAGLTVEPALTATVLAEVGGQPEALPMVSHALLETWRRREDQRLTLAGYRACGGSGAR